MVSLPFGWLGAKIYKTIKGEEKIKNTEAASHHFENALRNAKKARAAVEIANAKKGLAYVNKETKDYKKALEFADSAIQL